MKRPIQTVVLAAFVLGDCCVCAAQPAPGWSFWGAADGLKESYTSSVAIHAGSIWIKHGSVTGMNRLDGYGISELPDPGDTGKIHTSPDGTIWMWTGQQISRYKDARWEAFPVESVTGAGTVRSAPEQHWVFTSNRPPYQQARIWVGGIDADHALIMLPDRILEFEAGEKTTRVVVQAPETGLGQFFSMRLEGPESVWVTGQKGLGRLSTQDLKWHGSVHPPAGYTDLLEPYEGEDGEVFISATDESGAPTVLRLAGTRWERVYRGESRNLKGWRGEDKTVWIQDGNRLLHLSATGGTIPVQRTGPLSGVVLTVKATEANRFWVGTTQGLALYTPPLWRTPPETGGIDDVVSAIVEDKHSRVWFLSPHSLICLDGERWQFFPLPNHEVPWALHGAGLAILADGTLAIRTTAPYLLTFDPQRRQFGRIVHPAGRDIRLFIPWEGGLLVQTAARNSPKSYDLETFDGKAFHPFLNPGSSWGINDLRIVVMGDKGELWAGGSDGFGVYRNGSFSHIGAAEGFTDSGALCLKQMRDGRLLAGGRDGLFEFDGHAWHGILHGLDRVRNISDESNGSVWIASGTGVHRLQNGTQISHGIEEGLPSEVAYRVFEDSRGRIWAGTTRGISLLHPDADRDPPITQISAEQNAREAPPGGRVRLYFSGVDKWKVTPSNRLLFSWRMDGGAWSPFTGETSAALDKLRPGEHTFEVRAMDRIGNIDPHPPAYRFSVLAVWYETKAVLYLAGASALLIGFLLALAYSNYQLLSRKKKLERDRQDVLEMVARRERLETILRRVVKAIAENEQGAIGAALQYSGGVLQFLAFVEPAIEVTHSRGCWTAGRNEEEHDLAYFGLAAGPTVQIRSGKQEILGAMAAIFPFRARSTVGDSGVLEALSGIASVAIENAHLYDQLDHHAHHDTLTGLPNRWSIESELKVVLREARERGQSAALLFVDIDRFKHVNDSLGHSAGDSVLQQVASRLIQSLPEGAMAARTGGDEFVVVLRPPNEKPEAERVAIRILEAIRAPLTFAGNDLHLTVSIGISMLPQDGGDAVTLQRHADLAMYRAKSRRRDCYEFFSEDMSDSAAQILAVEQALRKALDAGWLELFYQAQFNQLGQTAGMEALVRLRHPVVGLIGPSDFIAIAEETGLIHRLGEWVLREACEQIQRWQDAGYEPVKIAVNVSALQFLDPSFAKLVGQILDETGTDPRLIELELTESMIMGDYHESARHMQKLRSLGVRIAVDDFGTGYCSLAHLHLLPIDVLKIDQSFVREIDAQSSTWPLVQAIVGLAHNLNLAVVAEGVETAAQRAALDEIGCDCVQGYGLHRPQPAPEIERSLLENARAPFSLAR